jgi:hypothetical protein
VLFGLLRRVRAEVFPQITPFGPVLYDLVIASKHGELIL